MKINALTGISATVIAELKKGKARTIELQSAHNIITLIEVLPGDHIFMTEINEDDLAVGDPGIVVSVISVSIGMKRMTEYAPLHYCEEKERMTARVKVQYVDKTTAKCVEGCEWEKPTIVDVIRSSVYHAG
ncbi:MAG: DUF473 domain-containing protein [Methanomicrobium sp.]|nr:DUF473 domain-containing protein [Methanomicrobium sp.]MBO4521733.1 DUF473 domain-containing protein [Methanomicrobium sp.]MBR6011608.1 DUF473 domain-containing protein [Methanomicrobium sp.]MBR6446990.1 DUF473 domain-containing protein [Methanomicrobium sp.]MBR6497239.1 DUF473 domain-containing protein [Methanomicrobium sp.]